MNRATVVAAWTAVAIAAFGFARAGEPDPDFPILDAPSVADAKATSGTSPNDAKPPPATPESDARPSKYYVVLFFGDFDPGGDEGKLDPKGRSDGYGFDVGRFVNPYVGVEGEFFWFVRDYERISGASLPGTANNDVRVISLTLSINVRLSRALWKLRPYVGAGLGYYNTGIYTTVEASGKFEEKSSTSSMAQHVMAGVGWKVTRRSFIELGWRRAFIEADFGVYSDGRADLGGDLYSIAYRSGGS